MKRQVSLCASWKVGFCSVVTTFIVDTTYEKCIAATGAGTVQVACRCLW